MGATCSGFKIRGLNQDANRVSVQSNVQDTWQLTYKKGFLTKSPFNEVAMTDSELIVLKCNDGAGHAAIEVVPLGDTAGTIICESSRKATQTLRVGSKYVFEMDPGESRIFRLSTIVYPRGAGAGMTV